MIAYGTADFRFARNGAAVLVVITPTVMPQSLNRFNLKNSSLIVKLRYKDFMGLDTENRRIAILWGKGLNPRFRIEGWFCRVVNGPANRACISCLPENKGSCPVIL